MDNNRQSPSEEYQDRISRCLVRLGQIKRIEILLSVIKLVIALFGIFSLYKIASKNQDVYLWLFFASLLLFAVPAVIHEYYIRKRHFQTTLMGINETEIKALDNLFPDYDSGEEYIDPDHAYSSDIDLFGPKSLFHMINRTTTALGRNSLAGWLQNPPAKNGAETIRARQEAVQELAPKLDLRQNIQVYGKQIDPRLSRATRISSLFTASSLFKGNRWLIPLIHILPILTLGSAGLTAAGLHWGVPLVLLLLHTRVNRRFTKKTEDLYKLSARNAAILKAYSRIIKEMESAELSTPLLLSLKNELRTGKAPVSAEIRRLSTIVSLFELRRSEILHPILNSLFFWDLHCVLRIERWLSRHGRRVPVWLDVVSQLETLSSFACLHLNYPGWTFPEITTKIAVFEARGLGHPLIPSGERVSNDFRSEGIGQIAIVTGPNMAGKSTFLKTLGINMVLAQAGSPVCAYFCRLSPFHLQTSMKVSDSLNQQISLFYAELLRLKNILAVMESGRTVFFLLDEMLKGTNALDRQAGALALLRQMTAKKTSGVVATHDLELTRLEKEFPKKIHNIHFDGYVEEDKLRFDFKLKPGRCESFNALTLMRKIGIDV
jgi:DNA mismatch repair ATPase MutS